MKPATLVDILLERASDEDRDRDAIVYLRSHEPRTSVTGAELLSRAQVVAAVLREAGVGAGDRVLLMLPAQRDFVEAFFGVAWLGAVPVPLSPPLFAAQYPAFIARFLGIAENAGARLLVTAADIAESARVLASELGSALQVMTAASWEGATRSVSQTPNRRPDELALLQYTSGSTGFPKGVALSHDNVLANVSAIARATEFGRDDVGVSWLPLYHDMGLLGGLLTTLYARAPLALLSPIDFAKDAGVWLRAISDERGTLSPAPNFAFRRCLRLTDEQTAGLDLSSWRVAFNGAEAVDQKTLERFSQRFGPLGFRSSTLYPVYGLAEATLAVAFPALGDEPHLDHVDRVALAEHNHARPIAQGDDAAITFVGVGRPLEGLEVELRGAGGELVDDGHVGELFVRGPSVMTGYFGNPAATEEVLQGGWLKTGDLAYRREGVLFITGRSKDLIIRAGRNYYPEDIEGAAGEVFGAVPGRVAAFSVVSEEGEATVVLVETKLEEPAARKTLTNAVAAAIAMRVGFRPERVELCARGGLPLTSSGKLRRREARALWERGELSDA